MLIVCKQVDFIGSSSPFNYKSHWKREHNDAILHEYKDYLKQTK